MNTQNSCIHSETDEEFRTSLQLSPKFATLTRTS